MAADKDLENTSSEKIDSIEDVATSEEINNTDDSPSSANETENKNLPETPVEDETEKKPEKKAGNKVFYLGEDQSYWKELKSNFIDEYSGLNMEYEMVYDINPSKNQMFITKMMEEKAGIIFVDLSKFSDVMLHILSNLVRLNAVRQPAIVALMDYTTPKSVLNRAILTGVSLVHIKSNDFNAVIFDSVCLAFNQALKPHSFATAKLDDYLQAFVPCKIGLLTSMGARVESNLKLNEGARYQMHNYWTKEEFIAEANVICANQFQYNKYYNFEYVQELGFEMVAPENENDDQEKREKRKELFTKCRKAMESWVFENQDKSEAKQVRVLVIDKTLSFYESDIRTDQYPYVIHCQPFLKLVKKELLHEFAHLIVFNFEDIAPEELKANEEIAYTYNEINTLQYILKSIQSISEYTPYVIVFNSSQYDSNRLQSMFNYKNIISLKEELTPELVIKMAQMLEQKLSESFEEYGVPLVVIPKHDLKSYGEFEISITIQAASEQDIYFTSDYELTPNTVLRIHLHGDIHVTVVPTPANSKYPESYYGLINCVNETDKMEIRRWVNQVFFRQLEEQKEAEREEVLRIKEQAIERKKQAIEEEKRRKEAEAERQRLEEEERERERLQQKEEMDRKAQKLAENDLEKQNEKANVEKINAALSSDVDVIKDGKED